jgi:hypothetical protein
MYDPGVDRHDWESEMRALEDQLSENPAETLPELESLVSRMLEESGYELTDPVVGAGQESEVLAEYLAAREITQAAERDSDELSPGDVAAAINGYRAVFDHLISERATADADLDAADEP